MFQACFKHVSRIIQECLRVFQWWFKACFVYILKHAWNIPENSLETCFKYISRLFYGCFNGVLRVYYGCLLVGKKIVVKKFFCQKNFIRWNVILVEKFFVSKKFSSRKILGNPNVCNSTISETIQTKKKHKIQIYLGIPKFVIIRYQKYFQF